MSLARARFLISWFVVVVVLVAALAPARNGPGAPDDEGLLLVYPEQVMSGAVPNRDYQSFYGPGNDYALGAVYSVLGSRVGVERDVGFLYRLVIVTAVFGLAATDGFLAALAAGLLSVAAFVYLYVPWYAFAWLGGVALGLCGLWSCLHALGHSCSRPQPWLIAAGALAGGAALFRVDLGLAVVLSALPALAGMTAPQRRWYLLGLLAPAVGLAVHLARAGVGLFLSNVAVDGVIRGGSQQGLPIPTAWSSPWVHLMLVLICSAGLCIAAFMARLRHAPAQHVRRLLAVALFALGLLPEALQRPDDSHFMLAGCVSIGLAPIAVTEIARSIPLRRPPRAALGAAAAALLAVCGAGLNVRHMLLTRSQPSFWVSHRERLFPLGTATQAADAAALLAVVERWTRPGERLFVGPANLRRTIYNDIYLYHLLPQLKPATYYLDMNPGSADRPGSRLASDIASADVLVLTTEYDAIWRQIMPFSRLGNDEPLEVIQRSFWLQGAYGPFRLYLRRASDRGIPGNSSRRALVRPKARADQASRGLSARSAWVPNTTGTTRTRATLTGCSSISPSTGSTVAAAATGTRPARCRQLDDKREFTGPAEIRALLEQPVIPRARSSGSCFVGRRARGLRRCTSARKADDRIPRDGWPRADARFAGVGPALVL